MNFRLAGDAGKVSADDFVFEAAEDESDEPSKVARDLAAAGLEQAGQLAAAIGKRGISIEVHGYVGDAGAHVQATAARIAEPGAGE